MTENEKTDDNLVLSQEFGEELQEILGVKNILNCYIDFNFERKAPVVAELTIMLSEHRTREILNLVKRKGEFVKK